MRCHSHVACWLAVPRRRCGVLWAPWPPLGLPTEAVGCGRGPNSALVPRGGGRGLSARLPTPPPVPSFHLDAPPASRRGAMPPHPPLLLRSSKAAARGCALQVDI